MRGSRTYVGAVGRTDWVINGKVIKISLSRGFMVLNIINFANIVRGEFYQNCHETVGFNMHLIASHPSSVGGSSHRIERRRSEQRISRGMHGFGVGRYYTWRRSMASLLRRAVWPVVSVADDDGACRVKWWLSCFSRLLSLSVPSPLASFFLPDRKISSQ